MPEFTAEHPQIKREIQGIELLIPQLFAEGHVLSANEAKFVNDRINSIMVNTYGGDIRRALEKIKAEREAAFEAGTYTGPMLTKDKAGRDLRHPTPAEPTLDDLPADEWDHQARVYEKFTNYRLGMANFRESNTASALDKVAYDIAERELKTAFSKKNIKIKPYMEAKNEEYGNEFKRLVNERLEKQHDRIYALAQAQIDSASEEEEDDLPELPELPEGVEKAA